MDAGLISPSAEFVILRHGRMLDGSSPADVQ